MTDILSLLTGLRPVVMVDYGGKMPELGEHLCALLHLARKVFKSIFLSRMINVSLVIKFASVPLFACFGENCILVLLFSMIVVGVVFYL